MEVVGVRWLIKWFECGYCGITATHTANTGIIHGCAVDCYMKSLQRVLL